MNINNNMNYILDNIFCDRCHNQEGNRFVKLPCSHIFHERCWTGMNTSCGICKCPTKKGVKHIQDPTRAPDPVVRIVLPQNLFHLRESIDFSPLLDMHRNYLNNNNNN